MRQVVLDTETTGLETAQGHRIIEIGALELRDRRLSGRQFHRYLNPQRPIDQGALEVHGISDAFLADKPLFSDVAQSFLEFIDGAELIIHNAAFDLGFLNHELALVGDRRVEQVSTCLDTLELARKLHPGMRNSLDALCKRYGVDNSRRDLHGALLDAGILAEVYLRMTGGQSTLSLAIGQTTTQTDEEVAGDRPPVLVLAASEIELAAHRQRLAQIDEVAATGCLWLRQEGQPGAAAVDAPALPEGSADSVTV